MADHEDSPFRDERPDVAEVERQHAQAHARLGTTIVVYVPAAAPYLDAEALFTKVADVVHAHEYEGRWDPFVAAYRGEDRLGIDHDPATGRLWPDEDA